MEGRDCISEWIRLALSASIKAGRAVLDVYEQDDLGLEYKSDQSPLTQADRAAHQVLQSKLESTGIPVLSEEGKHMPFETRQSWDQLWIVDPVDGTKEFIKRNGEFTVNVALVQHGRVAGGRGPRSRFGICLCWNRGAGCLARGCRGMPRFDL